MDRTDPTPLAPGAGRVRALAGPAAFGAGYLVAVLLGQRLSIAPEPFATYWPAAGLLVGGLTAAAPRRWPALLVAVALAGLLAGRLAGLGLVASIAWTLADALPASVGAALLQRGLGRSLQPQLRGVTLVCVVAAFAIAPLAALLDTLATLADGRAGGWAVWRIGAFGWLATLLGVLTVQPAVGMLVGLLRAPPGDAFPRGRWVEAAIMLAMLAMAASLLFGAREAPLVPPTVLYLFLGWAAVRFGSVGVAIAVPVLATMAIGYTAAGLGPWQDIAPADHRVLLAQSYVAVSTIVFHVLAAALAERSAAAQQLQAINVGLESRVARRTAELAASNARLRDREARLKRLIDANIIGVMVGSLDGHIIEANDYVLDLIGRSRRELDAGALRWDDITPTEQHSRDRQAIERALREGISPPYEKTCLRPDGTRVPILLRMALLPDEPGRGIAIVLDRSAARAATAALERTIDELRATEELLRDSDRRKNEFLAMLAHELRNPLAPIRNGIAVLRLSAGVPERIEWAADLIERQVAQMVRLIDDLLDVARIRRGTIALQRGRVDAVRAAAEVAEALRPQLEAGGRRFEAVLPAGPLWIDADPVRFAQVLTNLLNNAAKFTDRGGRIRLLVEAEPAEGDGCPMRWVRLVVEDDGIGIAPELLARVFEMFVQGEQSVERRQGGLGIGLTLVRRVVELHGGTVAASSEGPGRGARFVVRLPALVPSLPGDGGGATAPAAPPAGPAETPAGSTDAAGGRPPPT